MTQHRETPGFNGFCKDPVWNTTLTWDGSWPQFTDCFQWTFLTWIPCGFLWLLAPAYTAYLAQINVATSECYCSRLFMSKMVVLCSVLLITTVDAVNMVVQNDNHLLRADVFSPFIVMVTLMLALTFTLAERRKRLVTSGVQFLFWLLLSACRVVPFYTSLELKVYTERKFSITLSTAEFGLILVMFVLHCFAEQSLLPLQHSHDKTPCQELVASTPSRLTFWWLNWLLRTGYRTTLTEKSIPDIRPQDKCKTVITRFLPRWMIALQKARDQRLAQSCDLSRHPRRILSSDKHDERTPLLKKKTAFESPAWTATQRETGDSIKRIKLTSPSLSWILIRSFWVDLLTAQVWKLPYDLLRTYNPLLLGQLVDFVQDPSSAAWRGYVLALALSISMMIQSICVNQTFQLSRSLGLRMRAALVSALFRKALTMDNLAKCESTLGQVVNLMSVDTEHIDNLISDVWAVWSSVLQISLSLYLLYITVGVSMFAGAGFLLLLIPANGFAVSVLGRYQGQIMHLKDTRMKLMSEMLAGMKIIKLFAWERNFEQRILRVRDLELKKLLYSGYVLTSVTFSWTAAPFLTSVITYWTYVLVSDGHYLDPKTAFVAMSLFDILRFAMNYLPSIVTELTKAAVSARRISEFLRQNDLDCDSVTHDKQTAHAIFVRNGSFRWHAETKSTLSNVNLNIKDSYLTAVVGRVGCGKSSLLSALLGEMDKVSGTVNVRGSVAYVPQQAWIQNTSLRNNVLFGRPMDMALYNACLDGCALRPDLDILPAGDLTEIGEKGINLSGGQKQRVSLARALYAQADVYLLDDPLSAVDSHVGRHIFEQVIGHGGLLDGKVRVLVTHGVQYLPSTDHVLVMEDGRVTESGHYEKLLAHNGPFSRLITNYLTQEDVSNGSKDGDIVNTIQEGTMRKLSETEGEDGDSHGSGSSSSTLLRQLSQSMGQSPHAGKDDALPHTENLRTLTDEEKVETGMVKFSVVRRYLRSVGVFYSVVIVATFGAYGGLAASGHIFLSAWTDNPDLANFTQWPRNSSARRDANDYYISIYALFGVLQTVCIIIFSIVETQRLVAASRDLHASMLRGVVRAPMAFFDKTPSGRLINRFSKDMEEVDQQLPLTFVMWIDSITTLIGTFVVISYSTPIFIAFILPVAFVYLNVQRYFVTTSRQLKRLSSKTWSPIFNHFTESLTGASIIRAFSEQRRFELESEARVDLNTCFLFYNFSVQRWQAVRLEILGSIITMVTAGIAVINRGNVSGGEMGLAITYAMSLTNLLSWLVRNTSELETSVVSVERILDYTEVESEAPWDNDQVLSPIGWPKQGGIVVKKLCLRYREGLDLVLRNISFEVKPGEKVGIVGRTGAGKSSLTLALFRLVEAASGNISIDGVDISELGLHDLRPKITILPQDPMILSCSLRENLDPFCEYDDEAVWRSLEHVHLKAFVDGLSGKLGFMVGEGGENLSVGQRQLVCLARALLHKTKILVLDEATAAVDMETDELIQETIRTEFKDCTILTIAHRLNTVMDYDRILVLDKGEVKEFDSPAALLETCGGIFRDMAQTAGIIP